MQTHFPEQRLVVKPTVLWKSSTEPVGGLVHFEPIWGGGGGLIERGGGVLGGGAFLIEKRGWCSP